MFKVNHAPIIVRKVPRLSLILCSQFHRSQVVTRQLAVKNRRYFKRRSKLAISWRNALEVTSAQSAWGLPELYDYGFIMLAQRALKGAHTMTVAVIHDWNEPHLAATVGALRRLNKLCL